MKQAHLYVSGTVQGVGYRAFVRSKARKLGLTGWARNLPDGRVEALLQGPTRDIERVIRECERGPFLAVVENIDLNWEEIEESFGDFSITRLP